MNYLWDTNILMTSIRQPFIFTMWNEQLKLNDANNQNFISVVTLGEIYSIAFQRDWKSKKLSILQNILDDLGASLPIANSKIIQAYSKIDAYSQGKLKGQPLPKGMSARNMGKNDIWIAATAHALNLTLITTDKDFSHLNNVFCDIEQIEI